MENPQGFDFSPVHISGSTPEGKPMSRLSQRYYNEIGATTEDSRGHADFENVDTTSEPSSLSSPSSLLQSLLASSNSSLFLPSLFQTNSNPDPGTPLLDGHDQGSQMNKSTHSEETNSSSGKSGVQFGTEMGVFIPCMLGIFGVILFERLPWIIGQAGLLLSCLMMFIALCVVIPTALSVSAIATNGTMRGGGVYYMISRSLGPELGGSVGLIFFIAYTIAGGVFTVGFVDGFKETFDVPTDSSWSLLYGSITLAAMVLICFIGAEFYAKSALVIFVVLVVSLICGIGSLLFEIPGKDEGYTSWNWDTLSNNLLSNFNDQPDGQMQDFHSIFAIFFPAMTGIMAGANMSGDLKTPAQSIPKGTLSAITTACSTYLILMILFAATIDTYRLQDEYFIWNKVAFSPYIISVGIFAATLSSVLGSIIGCGNIFYALSQDELLPLGFFNNGSPRRSIILSWFLMQATLFIGELNTLATLQTMFFLFSYGVVNLACLTLILTGAPNFRPTWPYFNAYTCGMGASVCFGGMFYVDPLYAALCLLVAVCVFVFILFRQPSTNWGDVSQAIMYHQVRKYLLRLDPRKEHVKFWRPQVLLLVMNDDPDSLLDNFALLDFVNNLKKGGLYVIGDIMVGDFENMYTDVQSVEEGWRHLIDSAKLKAFPSVTVAPTLRLGLQNLISTAGVGMLKPNTIVIPFPQIEPLRAPATAPRDWFEQFPRRSRASEATTPYDEQLFLRLIHDCLLFKKNIILARHFESLDKKTIVSESRPVSGLFNRKRLSTLPYEIFNQNLNEEQPEPKTIDLWILQWREETQRLETQTSTLTLILLLGHILQQTDIWRTHTKLRVLSYSSFSDQNQLNRKRLQLKNLLTSTRISAEIVVVPLAESESIPDTLTSGGATQTQTQRQTQGSERADNDDASSMRSPREIGVHNLSDQVFVKLNHLIRSQTTRSSIIFLPLPTPPEPQFATSERSAAYVRQLSLLTDKLPPTLLLYSISGSVITADL